MAPSDLRTLIDDVEESYEFFLAYAAQGVSGAGGSAVEGQLREYLARMDHALTGLAAAFRAEVTRLNHPLWERFDRMLDVLEQDAMRARAAVQLVSGQSAVGSQLVDNLNASIHLRALLTDLFLVDEALGKTAAPPEAPASTTEEGTS